MLVTMSDKELSRINVIQSVVEKRMRRRDAAQLLALTERQTQRLMNRFRESGAAGLANSGTKPRWSKSGSSVSYTTAQVQSLTPIRQTVEKLVAEKPDLRDVFLCHAWDDRQGVAKELHDLLEAAGVKVWFSEKDLALGVPMMRAIDKGLANSRIGLVLVTPALLNRLPKEGVADKELSALLAGNQLVPIVHNTTYEALRNVSPLLASRSGLDTGEDTLEVVATKIAELITV
ncbi:TPA: TIR domain-containing protein [Escherichia coli]|nr:TIR domain-containing protein [Escherichia coli]HAV7931001.1 TIR domain-containing protein [Escherichia coli]HAV9554590.1 TIR domain-containing protein [Escherichia coli]HAW4403944.1 TIR domain-containing protein [Escherichia coli]HAW5344027.1 TIR domain-containing protein [Escherichia coli]